MAGKSGIARQLERVRLKFVQELDINKLLPRLLRRGIFTVTEEKEILSPPSPKKRTENLLDIISQKDRYAFAEFCKSLEECAPHLLTSLIVENQGTDAGVEDNPPTQALQLGFELALKERDAVLRENARAQEARDEALRQLEAVKRERDQAVSHLENYTSKSGKVTDGISTLDRAGKVVKDKPVVMETDLAYEELRFTSSSLLNNQNGPNVVWETHQVTLHKAPTFGFGIAVSGGRDSPHFANGDPSVAISDVLKAGPAEGKLLINDRIVSVNGISLENVDHSTAINVLRDCGSTVNLVVRRRTLLPVSHPDRSSAPPFKITLSKRNKKDDFGIILGYKLYIKHVLPNSLAAGEQTLREGDIVLKINNTPVENLSLAEARKLIDKSKDKLQLIVNKERRSEERSYPQANLPSLGAMGTDADYFPSRIRDKDDVNVYRPSVRSEEDIYVKDPTSMRQPVPPGAYPNSENTRYDGHYVLDNDPPIRASRPVENSHRDGYYSDRDDGWRGREDYLPHANEHMDDVFASHQSIHDSEPRQVTFLKDKQTGLGLRLAGGNATGIFIASVQPGSAGEREGLVEGDQIILANDQEITGFTREEAVSYLTSLEGEVTMVVQYRKEEYDLIMASHEAGDSFFIRAHFNYTATNPSTEHSFKVGDLFNVKDTLFGGIGGSWLAIKLSEDPAENKKGTIPNSKTAEILKSQQGEDNNKENFPNRGRGSLFKRKTSRRSKSLGKDHWDEVIFDEEEEAGLGTKFPAYERVVLREPGFVRPVVIFGAIADIAREKLLNENPDKFESPQIEKPSTTGEKKTAIIRLGAIREAIAQHKHCLLDVTPQNVDRLNYAQYNPIVIFLKADSKQSIKDVRSRWKNSSRNPRKLLEQSEKLEKTYSHLFTAVLEHKGTDAWFMKLCLKIDEQQKQKIWMSEKKPQEDMSDDFMFPMSNRMSIAGGAESDHEQPRPRDDLDVSPIRKKQLMRSSSDPSVNTQENIPGIPPYPSPPTYKNQKIPSDSKYSIGDISPRLIVRDDLQVHPEDRYYPSYYSDQINTISQYPPSRSHIDLYATLTPSERLHQRINTDPSYVSGMDAPYHPQMDEGDNTLSRQRLTQPGPAGDHRTYNDSSSHSSDSYSKYINSPQNKHDDTKLREKFGSLQIGGGGRSLGHDPYRFTRSTANPISGQVDKAKLSDLSARYRKQDVQQKPTITKQMSLPSVQQPVSKQKEPPPVPVKSIKVKQRGREQDELKRNYENSNRAYNYADVNTASNRYGTLPPSSSYPDIDRPYEYMSMRQVQSNLNNGASKYDTWNNRQPGLNNALSQHSLPLDAIDRGSPQPPPLPPQPSDADYYDGRAFANEVYMDHTDVRQTRGQFELGGGGGYTRPRTDDEQLEDIQRTRWRTKSETRLTDLSNRRPWTDSNSHSTHALESSGTHRRAEPAINENRGRNATRYKSWDTAKHEHDMFTNYTRLITTQGFVPQGRAFSNSHRDLRDNYSSVAPNTRTYANPLPSHSADSAFTSYKRPVKQSSFSYTPSASHSPERKRDRPLAPTHRSHSVGTELRTKIVSPGQKGPSLRVTELKSSLNYSPPKTKSKTADHMNGGVTKADDLPPPPPSPSDELPFLFSIMPLPPPPPITELLKEGKKFAPPAPPLLTFPLPPISQNGSDHESTSSILNVKVHSEKDGCSDGVSVQSLVGSKRTGDSGSSDSINDKHTIIATAKGIFTSKGGLLESKETGVSICIPEGAIAEDTEQEIYFKVCRDNSLLPPLDTEKGETLLSPLVMCGPHGIQFKKPVELRLPHCASANPESWSFALKSSESPTGQATEWQNTTLAGSEAKGRVDQNSVSILVDHF
ncbi:tight junction protein ZO-1-like isoform X3 [Biomphalaria glabrata]|uniref:Tight junction protein ZO-1-like isoform X3 n=1 Tax=Biomphalaria glabrata TaxID=6526 RepID=A0A9W2ZFI8_BIOGL|nr:tight junction protein ZO-1-like isoform X3 [Biomphalaria glabrata]